jgi:hypothetical protein
MSDLDAAIDPQGPVNDATNPTSTRSSGWTLSLRPLALFFVSRLAVFLVVAATANILKQRISDGLVLWDSKWYLMIASSGYASHIPPGSGNPAQSDLGFFPLMPLFVRLVHDVTTLGFSTSAFVAVFLLGAGGSVAVWWMIHDLWGTRAADRATAFVVFSPGAFVLSYVYSEAATLLFVALCLLALRRHRWILAGLSAGVASAADPVAVAVVVPCIVGAYLAIRDRRELRSLWAPLLAPAGLIAFFTYLWIHTGSPLEWFKAQRAGWQGGTYFGSVPRAFGHLFSHGFQDPNYAVKAICIVAVIAMLIVFFKARPPATWVGYVVAVLALGIISPVIGVTPRLLLRDFPLLAVLGARLDGLWFEIVFGFFAVSMAALTVISNGPFWTP